MPILDRLGYRIEEINSGQLASVLGPDDRGLKTGLDTRTCHLCCEIAVDPVTRIPMRPDRLTTARAYV